MGPENFTELYEPIEPELYRIAFIYLKNRDDALDCVQEAALRSFRGFKKLRNVDYFKTWAIRIVINCAKDILKRRKSFAPLDETFEISETAVGSEEEILNKITLSRLMDELTERERLEVVLHSYYDMSFGEMSKVTKLPLGTVKSVYYRAISKLRKGEGGDCE